MPSSAVVRRISRLRVTLPDAPCRAVVGYACYGELRRRLLGEVPLKGQPVENSLDALLTQIRRQIGRFWGVRSLIPGRNGADDDFFNRLRSTEKFAADSSAIH